MLRRGDRGEKVLSVQKDLLRLYYTLPRWGADADLGGETLGAVRLFEQDRHLPVSPNGVISPGTIKALASATPYLRGLDVSKHQGEIDWCCILPAGYHWVYIKATEGRTYVDPRWEENYKGACLGALHVGAYHFWWPERDPTVQAEHFYKVAFDRGSADLPPCLDVEMENDLKPAELDARLQALIDATKELFGVTPVIYSSRRVYREWGIKVGGECPFWMVSWSRRTRLTKPWTDWTLWQTGPASGVPGIKGKVDRNLFQGGEAELRRFIRLEGAACAG